MKKAFIVVIVAALCAAALSGCVGYGGMFCIPKNDGRC